MSVFWVCPTWNIYVLSNLCKFPPSSTGFILDGFPRYPEEAQFLGERGFFPDATVVIQVEDQDIFDRLLPAQVQKWKAKQRKKSERKKLIKDLKTKIRVHIQYKYMGIRFSFQTRGVQAFLHQAQEQAEGHGGGSKCRRELEGGGSWQAVPELPPTTAPIPMWGSLGSHQRSPADPPVVSWVGLCTPAHPSSRSQASLSESSHTMRVWMSNPVPYPFPNGIVLTAVNVSPSLQQPHQPLPDFLLGNALSDIAEIPQGSC